MNRKAQTAIAIALLALAGCVSQARSGGSGTAHHSGSGHTSSARSGLAALHDPGHVTGKLTGPCHARDNGQLPDRSCTPGAIDPAVTQANIQRTICQSGYTETVRPPESQTEAFKWHEAAPAYGLPQGTEGELDHLVSLELGGDNDAANLWIEQGSIPNAKDSVENALHRALCSGQVRLAAAQKAISRNWTTAERVLGISG